MQYTATTRRCSELRAADYNPRRLTKKQYADLKAGLTTFGLLQPIIVNMHPHRRNIIVGGHQRWRIWQDLGNEEIPCYEVVLSEAQERELNIRFNANNGEWDFDVLANEFDIPDLVEWGIEEERILGPADFDIPGDTDPDALTKRTVTCPHCGEEFEL